ncbi:MAG: hypothetical protein AAFR14_12300, partial [Bacteroidota bacterium]
MKIVALCLLICGCIPLFTRAQSIESSIISSAGGDISKMNVGLSWTLGESAITAYHNKTSSLLEGFLQSPTSSVAAFTTNVVQTSTHRDISVFPNPATDMIYISSSEKLHDDLKYNITTMLGTTIAQRKLNTRVSVEWMTPGTY